MLILIGIIVNSNYIRTRLSGLIQEVKSRVKNPIQILQNKINTDQDYRTTHWVGRSLLNELYYNFFLKKTDD